MDGQVDVQMRYAMMLDHNPTRLEKASNVDVDVSVSGRVMVMVMMMMNVMSLV